MTLFPGIGYLKVWDKMTGALEDLGLPRPSEKALRDLRRRLGPAKAVFETVAVPLASLWTRGVTWCGLRTVAFDGPPPLVKSATPFPRSSDVAA